MSVDPARLNLAGGLLVVLVVARMAATRSRVNLAPLAGDALLGLALAATLLLTLGATPEMGFLYIGASALAGTYWAALAEPRPRLSARGLALSALGAAGVVGALVFLALADPDWLASTALLLAIAGSLLVVALAPVLRPQPTPAFTPPLAQAPPKPAAANAARLQLAVPAPAPGGPRDKVTITCPACGLRGQVAAQGPPTLKCPRCGNPVQRPTLNASPPPGGAPAQSTPPPPRRGPSS